MKIVLLGDAHFGARNDSHAFMDFADKFYTNIFFPYLVENNIKYVIQLGDFFDRRKYINFNTLSRTKRMFLDKLQEHNIFMYVLAGNHDVYYKNSNELNSISLLLDEYKNIEVIDTPKDIDIDGFTVCVIPWICDENQDDCMKVMKNSTSTTCAGHFEISGFSMQRGLPSIEGLDRKLFSKFDQTFSGHYHHRSQDDNIYYVGTPMEITWSDYNDPKGFTVFDTKDGKQTFIRNTHSMFTKVFYDDKDGITADVINNPALYEQYRDLYIKVIVQNKSNPFLFDMFINKLYSVNPADVSIVETFEDDFELEEKEILSEAEDTITIINKVCDSFRSDNIDTDKLKRIMLELYNEAQQLETL